MFNSIYEVIHENKLTLQVMYKHDFLKKLIYFLQVVRIRSGRTLP